MRIKFTGEEADNHRLEAYEGLKSIDGLIRVARIATHYAATGEVRFRAPYTDLLETHFSVSKEGSFELVFTQVSKLTRGASRAKDMANSLINRIIMRGTGQTAEASLTVGDEKIPSGDIEAMVEAAEGGLKIAHRWITSSNKKISVNDDNREVKLDINTRSFVEDIEYGQETTRDVSVAALNVNNRTGRVYLHDAGHTVPFFVHKKADGRTITNLSAYLD